VGIARTIMNRFGSSGQVEPDEPRHETKKTNLGYRNWVRWSSMIDDWRGEGWIESVPGRGCMSGFRRRVSWAQTRTAGRRNRIGGGWPGTMKQPPQMTWFAPTRQFIGESWRAPFSCWDDRACIGIVGFSWFCLITAPMPIRSFALGLLRNSGLVCVLPGCWRELTAYGLRDLSGVLQSTDSEVDDMLALVSRCRGSDLPVIL